jgi:histone H3/H4
MAEEFTIAPMRRLLKKAGGLRINETAANALRMCIGDYGKKVAEYAVKNVIREERKTILERDIWKAAEMIWILESRKAE